MLQKRAAGKMSRAGYFKKKSPLTVKHDAFECKEGVCCNKHPELLCQMRRPDTGALRDHSLKAER
jgi:hypothetical protein